MSKKFLLSQSATTKVAIGLATISGVGTISYNVISQMADVPTEAEEKNLDQNVSNEQTNSEIVLPSKVTSILDNPIGPVNSNLFNSDKTIELESLNLENSTRVESEILPFETEVKYNNEKPSNYVNLIQEGSNGTHTVTYIDSFNENGKLIQTVKTLDETEEPTKQIIEIGTKENTEQSKESDTPTEIISNNSKANIELDSKTLIKPIHKDTIYTIDENLSKDETYTVKGEDGIKEVTTNTVSINGTEVHKETINEEVITPAVNDVTYISEEAYNSKMASEDVKEIEAEETTKDSNNERKIIKEERSTPPKIINFDTVVIQDENLPEGQVVIDQLGIKGSEYDVYQDVFVNNNLVSSTISKTVTISPVNQIERHGIKRDETKGPGPNEVEREILHEDKNGIPGAEVIQKIVKETKTQDIKINVIYDDSIPDGNEEVLEEGKPEITEITYQITSVNNEVISKEKINEEITEKGITRVVKRGTGKTTKSYETIVTDIPFETETINDNNLLPEESYIKQIGENGSVATEYETTYMNGNLVSKEVSSTHRLKEPVKEIKVVGTKIAQNNSSNNDYANGANKTNNIVDLSKTRDITLKQGLKDDDTLPNGIYVKYFTITDDTPLEKIVTLSENERYQKADKEYYNAMIVSHNGDYIETGIPLSQGGVDYINEHLDSNLLAMYMEQEINQLRTSLGKKPLRYKAELQQGTQQRADEQANIGSLRSGGKAHTRPDGTEFRTAFKYLNNSGLTNQEDELGENIAQLSSSNQYLLTSEKKLSEELFKQWKESPSHYENMISDDYQYFAFAVSIGRTTSAMNEYSELYPIIIGVQEFQ